MTVRLRCHLVVFFSLFPIEALQKANLAFEIISCSFFFLSFVYLFFYFEEVDRTGTCQ